MSELCHSATHVKREPGLWSKTNNTHCQCQCSWKNTGQEEKEPVELEFVEMQSPVESVEAQIFPNTDKPELWK